MMEVKTNKTFSYTYTTNGGAWPTLAHSLRIIIGKEKIKKGREERKKRKGGCRGRRGLGVFTRWRLSSLSAPSSTFLVYQTNL